MDHRSGQEIAESTEGHCLEESVQVYLRVSGGRWVVDLATVDGYPLDPVHPGGARTDECECGDRQGCQRARAAADAMSLPTGHDLYELLHEAFN
jgi:hypothetical protein